MKKELKSKKGFTLVEIIVVLVILAILAAATVPTMIGFVSKAKQSEELANARAVFLSVQSYVTEELAANDGKASADFAGTNHAVADEDGSFLAKVKDLSGHDITSLTVTLNDDEDAILNVEYTTDKYTVTIPANGSAEVVAK